MPHDSELVILVHGLWLHGVTMVYMKRAIERCGYPVAAYSYPSVRLTLGQNAARLARFCAAQPHARIHFVAHSMGGLVALKAAEALAPIRCGRIVLMGTPYRDCYAGRRLLKMPLGRSILGRCMRESISGYGPAANASCEIGVIAGTGRIGLGRFFAPELPRPNDGVVSIEETRVPGMRDHIVVPASHTGMLVSAEVASRVCVFLESGKFDRADTAHT